MPAPALIRHSHLRLRTLGAPGRICKPRAYLTGRMSTTHSTYTPGEPVVQPAPALHSATIILLHGLGASGQSLSPIGTTLRLPHVKWVYPNAPQRPVGINGGAVGPAWFDLANFNGLLQGHVDHEGVKHSAAYVQGLVDKEIAAGIAANRVVVAGFSQGGHLALKTALFSPQRLAGCVALSTWLEPLKDQVPESNMALPVFVGHGTSDTLLPSFLAQATMGILKQQGIRDAEQHIYQGLGHATNAQELDDVKDWLAKVIPEARITREGLEKLSAKQLKAFLASKGISTAGMLEKQEFLESAQQAL